MIDSNPAGDAPAGLADPPNGTPPRHLLHVMPSFGVGGIQVRLARVANSLGRKYRHSVIALDGVDACRDRLQPGVDVTVLKPAVDKRRVLGNFARFRAMIADLRPELLLTYNWGTIEWAMANRFRPLCRHVHFEDGFGLEEAERQFRRRVLFRRFALANADKVVVPSRTLERIALETWRLDPGHVAYIPNGIDVARFATATDPAALPALTRRAGELILGTVAPLRPEKNIGRLIRVFGRLVGRVQSRLVIVGDGSERPALEALAARQGLGETVLFAGAVKEPERVLGLFDAFAITSDTEQMPLTVIEAMAAGLPIVGVDVGDVKVMVDPGNAAFIVPKTDEAGLTEAVVRLLGDPRLRAELGRSNQARAREHFAQERMFAAYDRVFST
jgi:glycosyltransferase involved in cell wall biosynthesis